MTVKAQSKSDKKFDRADPVAYIARTREYYQALGYGAPYRWAHFDNVPFTPLAKPLSECRIALVTTAALYQANKGDQGPGAVYNAAAKFYRGYVHSIDGAPDVRISHIAYDRKHTTAEDINTWFPLAQMKRAADDGRIGAVTENFYGFPTNRSHETTRSQDCPDLLAHLQEDKADAAILVANCPVCHQSTALAARHLEAAGIATVVMGCAKDIVEHVGVPRFLFNNFPLGNAAGKPHNTASQAQTLGLALDLLDTASAPRTTWLSPLEWSGDIDWKLDYCNIERLPPEEISRRREEFDRQKNVAKKLRLDDANAEDSLT